VQLVLQSSVFNNSSSAGSQDAANAATYKVS